MSPDADIVVEGYLFKRATNAFKQWHRRWFAIRHNMLLYRHRFDFVLACRTHTHYYHGQGRAHARRTSGGEQRWRARDLTSNVRRVYNHGGRLTRVSCTSDAVDC